MSNAVKQGGGHLGIPKDGDPHHLFDVTIELTGDGAHKPSATAEGYSILTLDDLRPYAEMIEAQILKQAGIAFDAKAESGKLRVVAG